MKTNQVRKGRSIPLSIIIGICVSISLTLIGAAIAAALLESEQIGIQAVTTVATITAVIAAGLGSWSASKLASKQRMQVCLITGTGYVLLLLAITALFFDGTYEQVAIRPLSVLLSSALVGFLGLEEKRNRKTNHFKKVYR